MGILFWLVEQTPYFIHFQSRQAKLRKSSWSWQADTNHLEIHTNCLFDSDSLYKFSTTFPTFCTFPFSDVSLIWFVCVLESNMKRQLVDCFCSEISSAFQFPLSHPCYLSWHFVVSFTQFNLPNRLVFVRIHLCRVCCFIWRQTHRQTWLDEVPLLLPRTVSPSQSRFPKSDDLSYPGPRRFFLSP